MKRKSTLIIILIICFIAVFLAGFFIKYSQTTSSRAALPEGADIPILKKTGRLVPGFPADFPVYPGATLSESSERTKAINTGQDLHAVWISTDAVKPVMQWYIQELRKNGWTVSPPDDPESVGEQVAQISKAGLAGYIGIELDGPNTEIVADFRKTQ